MKRIAVLGSTGSIGTSALDVIAGHPDRLSLIGIAARNSVDTVEAQVRRHRPRLVCLWDADKAAELAHRCPSTTVVTGIGGLVQLVTDPEVDIVVVGTSGRQTLIPLLSAIGAGKRIALASKELLVMAGEIIMAKVRETGAVLIPVDSEHSALFQALQGVPREQIARIVLTGSGGSLWSLEPSQWASVTREQVLRHPKWQMGPKITVDSATLMNKGLEVIEARWLFDMPCERIRVVIHPQAMVHALVETTDGSCMAHMSICDMRLPIQYALSYPERWPSPLPALRLTQLPGLQFFDPDLSRFPCLALAMDAAKAGGTACTVLSAANDAAVEAYLRDALAFADIPRIIEQVLSHHHAVAHPTLEEVLEADRWARAESDALIGRATSLRSPQLTHEEQAELAPTAAIPRSVHS